MRSVDWYGYRRLLLYCLAALWVAAVIWNWRHPKRDYVFGDGGPIIVLPAAAVTLWQGSSGTMGDQYHENDFDAICRRSDNGEYGYTIKRYDSDILVLADSEWPAYALALPSGKVVIVQKFLGADPDDIESYVARLAKKPPNRSYPMEVRDKSLRLVVGADDGTGEAWGFKDVSIAPGKKRCDVYEDQGLIVVIRPAR